MVHTDLDDTIVGSTDNKLQHIFCIYNQFHIHDSEHIRPCTLMLNSTHHKEQYRSLVHTTQGTTTHSRVHVHVYTGTVHHDSY